MNNLYTIGYATKKIDVFISILKKESVDCVVDVRSSPYSKQFKEYNKENLENALKQNNIKYLHFGAQFGARRNEDDAYSQVNDVFSESRKTLEYVDFQKVYKLPIFLNGIERIKEGLNKAYKIAFMCSEKMPFNCHRALMISEYLHKQGINITHLIDEKTSIEHSLLDKLIKENFYTSFEKFKKINKEEIESINSCCDIFGNTSSKDNEIEKWVEFFSSYTREKGLYLRNIQISYKRGDEENE